MGRREMSHIKLPACALALALLAASCGTESNRFGMDGRFLNLNQGEFYVYSPDGVIEGLDTVKVNGGRFSHEISCSREGTLMLIFPNYSEQVVFAEPGKNVSVSADASHLKEMEVNGTKANKLMTRFRRETASMSPPDVTATAEKYIRDNPQSFVSVYLLRRYFLQAAEPDYDKALELASVLKGDDEDDDALKSSTGGHSRTVNGEALRLKREIELRKASAIGTAIPQFDAIDTKGRKVTNADIAGKTAIINTIAAWNHESINTARQLKKIVEERKDRLAVISISLDAGKKQCLNALGKDSLTWPLICDGDMFESTTLRDFGLCRVPDNIIVSPEGRIIAGGLTFKELKAWIEANVK